MIIKSKKTLIKATLLLTIFTIAFSYKGQVKETTSPSKSKNPISKNEPSQIGQYVVKVFEDSKGILWFGTIEKGVAKYDGKTLTYITTNNGLPSNRVTGIVEDSNGAIWFGTGSGLSKYSNGSFTNYTEKDGLCSNMISNLLFDSKGVLWIGTWNGVCVFDDYKFNQFLIPYPNRDSNK